MKIPVSLKHKPVVIVENYHNVDGRYTNNSDAQGLSLGLAQWNDRGNVDISAKVWRHTGGKWSRQSEELPLHRVLDLALLICKSRAYIKDGYKKESLYDPNKPQIEKIPLQGDGLGLSICIDNPMIDQDIELFRKCLESDDEIISERLHALSKILQEMGY